MGHTFIYLLKHTPFYAPRYVIIPLLGWVVRSRLLHLLLRAHLRTFTLERVPIADPPPLLPHICSLHTVVAYYDPVCLHFTVAFVVTRLYPCPTFIVRGTLPSWFVLAFWFAGYALPFRTLTPRPSPVPSTRVTTLNLPRTQDWLPLHCCYILRSVCSLQLPFG